MWRAGKGWYRIVYSPQEARTVIAAGKLAVVLGIEVDYLFNCHQEGDITTDALEDLLEKVTRARGAQQWVSGVTAEGYEVQAAGLLVAFESPGHGGIVFDTDGLTL